MINSYDPASPESKYTIQSMGGMNLSATHPKIDCNLFGYPIPQGNQQAFLINRYNPNGLIILRFGADNREVVEINTKYEIAVSALYGDDRIAYAISWGNELYDLYIGRLNLSANAITDERLVYKGIKGFPYLNFSPDGHLFMETFDYQSECMILEFS